MQGVTAIFGFYVEAASRALNRRMKLDQRQNVIPKAIRALADDFASRGEGYMPVADATELLDVIHPSHGKFESSLLTQLENEGVLAVELVREDDDSLTEVVRFTFERFSDHEIALRLLDQHLSKVKPKSSFSPGQPLLEVVAGEGAYRRAGVVEAIAIQLPERAG